MELNKSHRSSLLILLDKAKREERDSKDRVHNLSQSEEDINHYEIEHFLSIERTRLITESLTNNNIDY